MALNCDKFPSHQLVSPFLGLAMVKRVAKTSTSKAFFMITSTCTEHYNRQSSKSMAQPVEHKNGIPASQNGSEQQQRKLRAAYVVRAPQSAPLPAGTPDRACVCVCSKCEHTMCEYGMLEPGDDHEAHKRDVSYDWVYVPRKNIIKMAQKVGLLIVMAIALAVPTAAQYQDQNRRFSFESSIVLTAAQPVSAIYTVADPITQLPYAFGGIPQTVVTDLVCSTTTSGPKAAVGGRVVWLAAPAGANFSIISSLSNCSELWANNSGVTSPGHCPAPTTLTPAVAEARGIETTLAGYSVVVPISTPNATGGFYQAATPPVLVAPRAGWNLYLAIRLSTAVDVSISYRTSLILYDSGFEAWDTRDLKSMRREPRPKDTGELVVGGGAAEALAACWNKLMHMLNGNMQRSDNPLTVTNEFGDEVKVADPSPPNSDLPPGTVFRTAERATGPMKFDTKVELASRTNRRGGQPAVGTTKGVPSDAPAGQGPMIEQVPSRVSGLRAANHGAGPVAEVSTSAMSQRNLRTQALPVAAKASMKPKKGEDSTDLAQKFEVWVTTNSQNRFYVLSALKNEPIVCSFGPSEAACLVELPEEQDERLQTKRLKLRDKDEESRKAGKSGKVDKDGNPLSPRGSVAEETEAQAKEDDDENTSQQRTRLNRDLKHKRNSKVAVGRRIAESYGTEDRFTAWLDRAGDALSPTMLDAILKELGTRVLEWSPQTQLRMVAMWEGAPPRLSAFRIVQASGQELARNCLFWLDKRGDLSVDDKTTLSSAKGYEAAKARALNKLQHIINGNIDGYSAWLALTNNKRQHSTNGNMFGKYSLSGWDETDQKHESLSAMLRTAPVEAQFQGADMFARTANLSPELVNISQPIGVHDIYPVARVSLGTAAPVNGVIESPEIGLYPITWRNAPGAAPLGNNPNMPQAPYIVPTQLPASMPLTPSDDAVALEQYFAKTGLRSNSQMKFGFRPSTVASCGLSAESVSDSQLAGYLRMQLYRQTLAWADATAPTLQQVNKLDNYTSRTGPATLSYNGSNGGANASYGYLCGGAAAPILPTQSTAGPYGTIYFHQCEGSVPSMEQDNVICIRDSHLSETFGYANPGINIALEIMFCAPYPCGFWQASYPTVDGAGGNAGQQRFIPYSNLVQIGGEVELHVVLPIKQPSSPPNNFAAALSNLVAQPITGPTAGGALGANAVIAVNYPGGPLVGVDMAEYLYTWLANPNSPIRQNTIDRWCLRDASVMSRGSDLLAARNLAYLLSWQVPNTIRDVRDVSADPASPDTVAVPITVGHHHARFYQIGQGNLPWPTPSYQDMLIPIHTARFRNRMKMGTAVSKDPGPASAMDEYAKDSNSPQRLQYSRLFFRCVAMSYQAMYRYFGCGARMWEAVYNGNAFPVLYSEMRKMFSVGSGATIGFGAAGAPVYQAFLSAMFSFALPTDSQGLLPFDYMMLPRNMLIPRTLAGVTTDYACVPQLYPNIMIALMALKTPIEYTLWPHGIMNRVMTFPSTSRTARYPGGRTTVPASENRYRYSLSIEEVPEADCTEIYNAQALRISGLAPLFIDTTNTIVDAGGNLNGIVPTGYDVYNRLGVSRDFDWPPGVPNYSGASSGGITAWAPVVLPDGRNVLQASSDLSVPQWTAGVLPITTDTFMRPAQQAVTDHPVLGGKSNYNLPLKQPRAKPLADALNGGPGKPKSAKPPKEDLPPKVKSVVDPGSMGVPPIQPAAAPAKTDNAEQQLMDEKKN